MLSMGIEKVTLLGIENVTLREPPHGEIASMTEQPDVPGAVNFPALREELIPLPASEPDGFRHVLFVGTTGAGKTTLVRQLIGTHPATERFPSTSTAKCTIHDTEIILSQAPWRAVVTFVSSEQARGYLNECISAALLAVVRGEDDATVLSRLLDHVEQRFRFSYVLGRGPTTTQPSGLFGDEDEEGDGEIDELAGEASGLDLTATNELLTRSLEKRNLPTPMRHYPIQFSESSFPRWRTPLHRPPSRGVRG